MIMLLWPWAKAVRRRIERARARAEAGRKIARPPFFLDKSFSLCLVWEGSVMLCPDCPIFHLLPGPGERICSDGLFWFCQWFEGWPGVPPMGAERNHKKKLDSFMDLCSTAKIEVGW